MNMPLRPLRVLCALCAISASGFSQKPAAVKLATVLPAGTSYHRILQAMAEEWRKTPGGVPVIIYTGSQMGDEADIVRRMGIGQLHAGVLSVVGLSEIEKSVTALSYLPMMFRSLEEVDFVRTRLQPDLEDRLLKRGYVVLFWGDTGWVRFFSKEPVLHPGDLKRMKIFAWAGDNYQVDLMKSMGYQPVPLVSADILPGLQTGLISVVSTAPFYALAGQVYGPARHMLELNWAPLVGATVIARNTWEAIPAATREALAASARKVGDEMRARGRAEADQAVEAMKKRGLKVQPVSAQVEAEWRALAEGVYPRIRGAMVPAEMFDEVQRLLKEYRSKPSR
ncbi:MAG: C4-dicarboxylate ABC transporter substrate-binding protein [Acidobacteria bacterium]|nr:C4-dicarboxylate ABC transporter substrate-binding protein [Acidobacteriota bacterium]